ncbi:hypothetical protein N7513_001557 [Penicillium frequentans]|nr:hypothetical protein N7513_001557 [Penicillium glabrum]
MPSLVLPRIAFLGLVGLLGLLLVHRTFQVASGSLGRIHARDLGVSPAAQGWEDQNLTALTVSPRDLAIRADLLSFDTAVNKGNGLFCKCKAKWQLEFESDWILQDELERYWSEQQYARNHDTLVDSSVWLQEALTGLGLPYERSSNNGNDGKLVPQFWLQNVEWETEVSVNGAVTRTEQEATDGFYINIMSPAAGLIIAENNQNPAIMSGGRSPPLSKWSDVVFINWATLARSTGSSVGNLKYLIRTHIVNLDTLNILKIVCGGPCPAWPGTSFDINQKKKSGVLINQNGLALLGTPNGGGAAWLLINHKQQLGARKAPVSVTAWTTPGTDKDWYHMVFQFST